MHLNGPLECLAVNIFKDIEFWKMNMLRIKNFGKESTRMELSMCRLKF
jgi:hypothetical protein